MNLQPRIENLNPKKLIGIRVRMSLKNNKTFELWNSFVPRLKEITNRKSNERLSLQVYESPLSSNNLTQEFEKWALVEVLNFEKVPQKMETFILESGLYAVFYYKGLNTDHRIFRYIFNDWLPKSNYVVDKRPHFEILGEKYKNADPNSEEEIWIPIRKKNNLKIKTIF